MVKNSNDFVKLNELDCEKNKLNEELEYKMERWEYLTELDERIGMKKKDIAFSFGLVQYVL